MNTKLRSFDDIANILADTSDYKEVKSILRCLLTDKELLEISNRFEILQLLENDVPQREIAKLLGVGIATVTRGAREFKSKNFRVLEKHIDSAAD